MDSNSPIGVFDSGLGGLTVLKELRRLLPHENFIFVGDSARAPYGSRTPEEIISFLQQFMDYFQSRGVKMAVCACNTMTSYGYPVIKDKTSFALVPMNPAIIPAVKASANKHIGVIATEATIKKGMHKQAASNLDPQIKNEEWIWLFSDDDLMEDNCIRDLNHQINLGIKEDVIHFNINIIDNQDKLIRKTNAYPDHLSSADFFKKLYSWKIEARMPEFVLRRSTFEEKKGFVNFDLAWRSDNATIIKLAHPNGIKSIDTSRINWRYSNENISGINNLSMIRRKQDSTIKFFNWMDSFLKATKQKYPFGRIYRNIIFSKFLYIRQLNNPEYVFQRLNQVNTPLDKFIIKIYLKTL